VSHTHSRRQRHTHRDGRAGGNGRRRRRRAPLRFASIRFNGLELAVGRRRGGGDASEWARKLALALRLVDEGGKVVHCAQARHSASTAKRSSSTALLRVRRRGLRCTS
jgi:hypothetical protein